MNPYSLIPSYPSLDRSPFMSLNGRIAGLLVFTLLALVAFTIGLALNQGIGYTVNQLSTMSLFATLTVYGIYATISFVIGLPGAFFSRSIYARSIGGLALGFGTQADGLVQFLPRTIAQTIESFITQHDQWIQGFFAIVLSIFIECLANVWRFNSSRKLSSLISTSAQL